MHDLTSNNIHSPADFLPLFEFTPPYPDDILDTLIDALRATIAHPDAAFQALAADVLDQVRRIEDEGRRKRASQRRAVTSARLAVIIQSIECQFRLEPGTLLSGRPTQRIAARQLAMYSCRCLTSASYPIIPETFHRDHSTAIHNCDLIRCRCARNTTFRSFVQQLERQIAGPPITTEAAV